MNDSEILMERANAVQENDNGLIVETVRAVKECDNVTSDMFHRNKIQLHIMFCQSKM